MKKYLTTKKTEIDKTAFGSNLRHAKVDFMSDSELADLPHSSVFVFDVECYPNFFYIAFKSLENGKYVEFEQSPVASINVDKLCWMLWRFCIVGFNSRNYDIPMVTLALTGANCIQLKEASDTIIAQNLYPKQFETEFKVRIQNYNHIDIIEVAPLKGSLKLYGGRLHCKTMQDLPFDPDHFLTDKDAEIVRPYCCNDLKNTEIVFDSLADQLKLRCDMSKLYGMDLRSKSDSQIAESVINSEIKKVTGFWPKRPKFNADLILKYELPEFIRFGSPRLNKVSTDVRNASFALDAGGKPKWPEGLGEYIKDEKKWSYLVTIGSSTYKLGMGGLHSQEESTSYVADENTIISDNDVESYYPRIILNQRLFPPHLGEAFLDVYESIVNRRISAKRDGDKVTADSLKITINGSFGKLGSCYSTLYAPQLLLQVTLTGQLSLLMLIEMLEDAGISCISGNTDGVVSMYPKDRHEEVRKIIKEWENQTNFKTEETRYKTVYSRDVNNYIAVKIDDSCKTKGTYGKSGLSKNPEHYICSEAVLEYVTKGVPIAHTIENCRDIGKFVVVKNVRGGGHKDGIYLGKVVRWYYAIGEKGCIQYVGSGNKVGKSDFGKPLMDLPDEFPDDINYEWYIEKATEMLYDCGALKKLETPTFF